MRKILISLLAIALAAPVFAQPDPDDDESGSTKTKQNAVYLGIKAGGTLTTMTQPDEADLYDKSGYGYSAGLAFKMRFGKASEASNAGTGLFAVGAELKYKLNSVKTKAIDEDGKENAKLELGYFEVPVYGQIYPFVKSNAFNALYIEAGVSFAGTISRKPETLTLDHPNDRYSKIIYDIDHNGSKLKGMDVRPIAGLGYTFPGTGLDVNFRYYFGTSKLAENLNSKMNSAELSLAYYFSLGKF